MKGLKLVYVLCAFPPILGFHRSLASGNTGRVVLREKYYTLLYDWYTKACNNPNRRVQIMENGSNKLFRTEVLVQSLILSGNDRIEELF